MRGDGTATQKQVHRAVGDLGLVELAKRRVDGAVVALGACIADRHRPRWRWWGGGWRREEGARFLGDAERGGDALAAQTPQATSQLRYTATTVS